MPVKKVRMQVNHLSKASDTSWLASFFKRACAPGWRNTPRPDIAFCFLMLFNSCACANVLSVLSCPVYPHPCTHKHKHTSLFVADCTDVCPLLAACVSPESAARRVMEHALLNDESEYSRKKKKEREKDKCHNCIWNFFLKCCFSLNCKPVLLLVTGMLAFLLIIIIIIVVVVKQTHLHQQVWNLSSGYETHLPISMIYTASPFDPCKPDPRDWSAAAGSSK